MNTIIITRDDVNNAKDCHLAGTNLAKVNQVLFETLVPLVGKASTMAGERVRVINDRVCLFLNRGYMPNVFLKDNIDALSEVELTLYLWNYIAPKLATVAKSRVGKAALKSRDIEVRFEL